jgi:hypothetical protein
MDTTIIPLTQPTLSRKKLYPGAVAVACVLRSRREVSRLIASTSAFQERMVLFGPSVRWSRHRMADRRLKATDCHIRDSRLIPPDRHPVDVHETQEPAVHMAQSREQRVDGGQQGPGAGPPGVVHRTKDLTDHGLQGDSPAAVLAAEREPPGILWSPVPYHCHSLHPSLTSWKS